jgi:chromosome segregation and condensation protein ScpB
MRGLIKKSIHQDDSRKTVYTATPDLLQFMGISKNSDLSEYESVSEKLKDYLRR